MPGSSTARSSCSSPHAAGAGLGRWRRRWWLVRLLCVRLLLLSTGLLLPPLLVLLHWLPLLRLQLLALLSSLLPVRFPGPVLCCRRPLPLLVSCLLFCCRPFCGCPALALGCLALPAGLRRCLGRLGRVLLCQQRCRGGTRRRPPALGLLCPCVLDGLHPVAEHSNDAKQALNPTGPRLARLDISLPAPLCLLLGCNYRLGGCRELGGQAGPQLLLQECDVCLACRALLRSRAVGLGARGEAPAREIPRGGNAAEPGSPSRPWR